MKKNNFLLSIFFMLIGVLMHAQDAKLKEEAVKAKARRMEVKRMEQKKTINANNTTTVNNVSAGDNSAQPSPVNENDTYMGRKAEFLNNLTVSELPADFPTYDKSYGLRYYNNLVDNWYAEHKDLLKEKVRNKIEHSYPSK